jgi:hypothetical protein
MLWFLIIILDNFWLLIQMKISLLFYWVKISAKVRIWPDNFAFWPDIVRWPAVIPRPVKGVRGGYQDFEQLFRVRSLINILNSRRKFPSTESKLTVRFMLAPASLRLAICSASSGVIISFRRNIWLYIWIRIHFWNERWWCYSTVWKYISEHGQYFLFLIGPVHMSKSYPG